jgi:hypothetical protein
LCERFDLDYNNFKPFESDKITKLMNREEALNYLWDELCKHVISIWSKKKI